MRAFLSGLVLAGAIALLTVLIYSTVETGTATLYSAGPSVHLDRRS